MVPYSQLGGCYPRFKGVLFTDVFRRNCSRSKTSRSHGLSMSGYEVETFWSPWASLGHVKIIALHRKTTGFLQVLVTLYMLWIYIYIFFFCAHPICNEPFHCESSVNSKFVLLFIVNLVSTFCTVLVSPLRSVAHICVEAVLDLEATPLQFLKDLYPEAWFKSLNVNDSESQYRKEGNAL